MLRGVLIAFGVTIALTLLPVPLIAFPLAPFIGGFAGAASLRSQPGTLLLKGAKFGGLLGLLVLLVLATAGAVLTVATELNLVLIWVAVGVLTFYAANMSALGAMYGELRWSRRAKSDEVRISFLDMIRRRERHSRR